MSTGGSIYIIIGVAASAYGFYLVYKDKGPRTSHQKQGGSQIRMRHE
jgi:hypothetical protein